MNLYSISYTNTPICAETGEPRCADVLGKTAKDCFKASSKVVANDVESAISKLRSHFVDHPAKSGNSGFTIQRVDTILSVENFGAIDIL